MPGATEAAQRKFTHKPIRVHAVAVAGHTKFMSNYYNHYRNHDAADDDRADALTDLGIDPRLVAIDPYGCGCTECDAGEHRPLQDASVEEIRALWDGLLRDNNDSVWSIDQAGSWAGCGWDASIDGHSVRLDTLSFPLPVEHYTLTLNQDQVQNLLDGATSLD